MGYKSKEQLEFEEKLVEKIGEIHELYKEYNPEGTYLDMQIYDHDEGDAVVSYHACNAYYGKDNQNPVNLCKIIVGEEDDVGW